MPKYIRFFYNNVIKQNEKLIDINDFIENLILLDKRLSGDNSC